jgi:hypothetical protein
MPFKRANPAEYSVVERSVLCGLVISEADGFDFQPSGPRERVMPERIRIQHKVKEGENKRLAVKRSSAQGE